MREYRSLSLQNLFGRKLLEKCPVARRSLITIKNVQYIQILINLKSIFNVQNNNFNISRSSMPPNSTESNFVFYDLTNFNHQQDDDFNIHFDMKQTREDYGQTKTLA
jgi:hypothetical protein